MQNKFECPYCFKPLPAEPTLCCGEFGHAVVLPPQMNKVMDALVYDGRNRFKRAWLMGAACYAYTRSWDGVDGMDFGRWYSFKCAMSLGWEYLWRDL